jgi:murein DD-endopeptidase MepM/ murein hydrolase activator NlpD
MRLAFKAPARLRVLATVRTVATLKAAGKAGTVAALRTVSWRLAVRVLVPGAVLAAILDLVLVGVAVPIAQALDSTGGVAAPTIAVTNAPGLGGAVAPSTEGTGGSEYGVVLPKPRATSKPTSHEPSPAAHRTHVALKPKAPAPKPKPRPKPARPAPVSAPTGVPTPAQTVAEGAVFPVVGAHSFGGPENRFGAAREGHIHEGQDVLANEGLQVIAPLAGTIIRTAYQAGGAGWYAAEHTVDGLDFFYAHCQASSLAVTTGEAVKRGQAICKVGQTGDATGPHLHFEVWVGGWQAAGGKPIDPLAYLEAWEASGESR